jgi:hypothetical protein
MTVALQSNITDFGFQSGEQIKLIEAEAVAYDGFYVRQEIDPIIGHYLRSSADILLWPMIKKMPAEADLIQEMVENDDPAIGLMEKNTLVPVENPTTYNPLLPLPGGQRVKALGGVINLGYYAQSLWLQQGKPYGPQLAMKTDKAMSAALKALEKCLFRGNATTNPLEFNGLEAQMAPGHTFERDISGGHKIVNLLRGICRLAINDELILRGITHIFTSALGVELIENQTDAQLQYMNLDRVTPGLNVPSINTQRGTLPILNSPFIRDTPANPAIGQNYDIIHYWLLDLNQISWRGVIPKGGTPGNYNPQFFDATQYSYHSGMEHYMIEKRLLLQFGTLFVGNAGQSIWKLSLRVPAGTIGDIGTTL